MKRFLVSSVFYPWRCGRRTLVTLPRITKIFDERVLDNILHPPYDIHVPKITYTDMVWEGMETKGHLPAMTCGLSGRTLSHGELQEEALKLSKTLQGLNHVKTIGILLPNCVEYPAIICGSLHAGVTVTTLNPAYTPSEIAHQLEAARVDILFAANSLQEKVSSTVSLYSKLSMVVFVDAESQLNTGSLKLDEKSVPYSQFLSVSPARSGARIDTVKDTAIMPFSSGTTGPPKGVELSQHNLVVQCLTMAVDGESFYRAFGKLQDVTVAVLPLYHIFGLAVTMTGALWAGSRQVTLPRFDSDLYIRCLEKYSPTYLHMVPPIVGFLASSPKVSVEHLSSLRQVNCGAAPCGLTLIEKFALKAPRVLFREGWGMTETTGAATAFHRSYQESAPGSVNTLLPNLRMRIVDSDTDEILGVDQTGELQVKGEGIMKGYFNNEEATRKTFSQDGWMKTGDVGYYNKDGIIYISDRIKELIKVNGLQVAPAELENTLRQLDGVEDVAVVGVQDERAGQLPRAFIVRSGSLTEADVKQWMSLKLSAHKQPNGGVVFVDSIPKSAAGKILRKDLVGK